MDFWRCLTSRPRRFAQDNYQMVLPGRFRGHEVPIQIRAIGFKALTQRVRLTSDTVLVDVPIATDAFLTGCVLSVVVIDAPAASKAHSPRQR